MSYYGKVKNDQNYDKLKNLASYGGTTWDARPEAINQLTKYLKTKPKTIELFLDFLNDPSRNVRKNCIRALGKYGTKDHIDHLDEVLIKDPILSRDIRFAKNMINKNSLKGQKNNEEMNLLNQKIEDIRKIIN